MLPPLQPRPAIHRVREAAVELSAKCAVFLRFVVSGGRRAAHIERTMVRLVNFDQMLLRLSPLAEPPAEEAEQVPGGAIAAAAEFYACLFPRVWRRRCLFRSLLILDWAHRVGIDPTLNVGMQLGPKSEQGHCWLSVGGKAFCDRDGWPTRYPVLFHTDQKVVYWAGWRAADRIPQDASVENGRAEGAR